MKAAVATTASIAVPLFLQGCDDSSNTNVLECRGRPADQCILPENNDGSCHWDPATSEEECILQEGFDEALFEATKPTDVSQDAPGSDSKILFGSADDAEGDESCATYDAVPAQRCYSKCEVYPEYAIENRGDDRSIKWESMAQEAEFLDQQVAFLLPNLKEGDAAELLDHEQYFDFLIAEAANADWTPYGDASLGADTRLQCVGFMDRQNRGFVASPEDPRSTDDDTDYIKLFPNPENDDSDGRSFKCGGKTNEEWRQAATAAKYGNEVGKYFNEVVFADKDRPYGRQAWLRMRALTNWANEAASQEPDYGTVSIVGADLAANNFLCAAPFDACQSDRNCGMDFESSTCVKAEDFCAQFSASECPGDELDDMLPYFKTQETYPDGDHTYESEDLNGTDQQRQFAGTAYFSHGDNTRAAKCASYGEDEEAACAINEAFVSCETIGIPTQDTETQYNVCNQVYPDPVQWTAEEYDVFDITTFSTNYMIDGAENNPRGCVAPSDFPSNDYQGGVFGYSGPTCTYPSGWDCTVAAVEPAPETAAADAGDDESGGDDDDDDDSADEEPTPFESAEECRVTLEGICVYSPAIDGFCANAEDYYATYFGERKVESFIVTFEPEEASHDDEAGDDEDSGDEGLRSGSGDDE